MHSFSLSFYFSLCLRDKLSRIQQHICYHYFQSNSYHYSFISKSTAVKRDVQSHWVNAKTKYQKWIKMRIGRIIGRGVALGKLGIPFFRSSIEQDTQYGTNDYKEWSCTVLDSMMNHEFHLQGFVGLLNKVKAHWVVTCRWHTPVCSLPVPGE